MAARRAGSSAWASSGEEDVTMGILGDEGEPGVEAGSEEATCRQRATKESMKMLQTEERTKECDSRGELGDMGVVAGDGAESQDQEVRAQRGRRELGEEERRHRRGTCVSCCRLLFSNVQQLWGAKTCRSSRFLYCALAHSVLGFHTNRGPTARCW